MAAIRANNRVITLEIEGSPGVDPGAPTIPDDVLDLGSFDRAAGIQTITIDELRAALDRAPDVRGPVQPTAAVRLQMKGSGAVATVPNVGRLLRIAGLAENVRTVVPAAGTSTATSGTTTTLTIDRAVETDWSANDNEYIGRIIELTVNPATATRAVVIDYQVTGNNCVVTLDRTLGAALDNTTEARLLPGVQYTPHSGAIPTGAFYDYNDGLLTKLLGSMADLTLNLRAGQPWELTGNVRSLFPLTPQSDVALPAYTPSTTLRPSIWRNGGFAFASKRFAGASLTVNLGNDLQNPPNPNAEQALDPTELVGRAIGGEANFLTVLTASRAALHDALNQTVRSLSAIQDESAAAGNRWALCVPGAQFMDHSNTSEQAFSGERLPFRSTGTNALALSLFMF